MACFTSLPYRNKFYPLLITVSDAAGISPISFGCFDAASDASRLYQFYLALYIKGTLKTAGAFVVGQSYRIIQLGTTNWNTAAGTTGITYAVGDTFTAAAVGSGTGKASSIPVAENCFVQKTEDQQLFVTNEALALALPALA